MSPSRPPLRFTKMHGAGNDFVVLDLRRGAPPPDAVAWPHTTAEVSAILATTPGLPQSQASRDRLRDLLVEGQCTIDALREVQNPINRQALLVLLAGLDGC